VDALASTLQDRSFKMLWKNISESNWISMAVIARTATGNDDEATLCKYQFKS